MDRRLSLFTIHVQTKSSLFTHDLTVRYDNGRSTDVSIDSRIGSVNKNCKLNRRLPSQMKQINKEMK